MLSNIGRKGQGSLPDHFAMSDSGKMSDGSLYSGSSGRSSPTHLPIDGSSTDMASPETQVLRKLEHRLKKEKGVISERLDFFNQNTADPMSAVSIAHKSELTRNKLANLCK